MPTDKAPKTKEEEKPENFLDLKELTALLIKNFGYREGLYDLAVQLQVGIGSFGPAKDNRLPGAVVGLAGVGLKKVTKKSPNTLDAAEVNPARKVKKRLSSTAGE